MGLRDDATETPVAYGPNPGRDTLFEVWLQLGLDGFFGPWTPMKRFPTYAEAAKYVEDKIRPAFKPWPSKIVEIRSPNGVDSIKL